MDLEGANARFVFMAYCPVGVVTIANVPTKVVAMMLWPEAEVISRSAKITFCIKNLISNNIGRKIWKHGKK